MTAQELSRAGIALKIRIEVPIGSGKEYDLLLVPTKDLKKHQGKPGMMVVTYTEFEGVCSAHARSQDDRIGFDTIVALVRFRESAAKEGVSLFATKIGLTGDDMEA